MSIDSNHLLDPDGLSYLLTQLKSKFSRATNLVNGSVIGSLRNIHSATEDSNYTMGQFAIALGTAAKASGTRSFASGHCTTASGEESHAIGCYTEATGSYAYAEGYGTEARGEASHAQNNNTIAASSAQTALGRGNIIDADGVYAVIVGNGGTSGSGSSSRSNALTVDWDGNVYIQGDVQTSASEALYQSTPTYPSSAQSHGVWMYDSSGTKTEEHRIAGYQAYIGTTGNVYSSLYAYKSDGSADKACIEAVYQNSDGTKYIAANCDVNVTGGISATGNASINGTLSVVGAISASSISTGEGGLTAKTTRNVSDGGGWSYRGLRFTGNDDEIISSIGVFGTDNNYSYMYLGNGAYNSNTNVKIYANGNLVVGEKTAWNVGTGCMLATDGTMCLQSTTSASNAYGGSKPNILFLNANGSQNIQLVFTDYDSVQSPSSLTLIGNQGGEYFIAPNIKTTDSMTINGVTVMNNLLRIVRPSGGDMIQTVYDSVNRTILHHHNNGNISLSAVTGGLYLGYFNTTSINFLGGKLSIDSSGNILGNGSKTAIRPNVDTWLRINDTGGYTAGVYFGSSNVRTDGSWLSCGSGNTESWLAKGQIFAHNATGEAQVQARNSTSGNRIYLYANHDGRTGIYGFSANGTAMSFMSRANNSSTLVINSGLQVNTTNAIISTSAGTGVYFKVKNSHHEGSLYVSDASDGNFGIYSNTLGKWVFYTKNTNGHIYLPPIAPSSNVSGGAGNLFINTSGRVVVAANSSKRYKHDIQPLTDYQKVLDIPVVSFKYNEGYLMEGDCYEGLDVPGLIAEDVARCYPIAAMYENNQVENWNIRHIVPAMLAVEQDHEKQIKLLTERVEQLSQENERLKQRIEAIA